MNVYDAMNNGILDYEYKMSFGRLHEFVVGQDKVANRPGGSLWIAAAARMIRFGNTLNRLGSNWF